MIAGRLVVEETLFSGRAPFAARVVLCDFARMQGRQYASGAALIGGDEVRERQV